MADPALSFADLARLLTDQTPASILARHALLTGGTFQVFDGTVPANQSAGIYGGRLRRMRKRGTSIIGGDETLAILRSHGEQPLRIGGIRPADRSWYYPLYLNPDATTVLAVSGHEMGQPQPEADE